MASRLSLWLSALFIYTGCSLASPSSTDIWTRLNTTLQGRLQISSPYARPCFSVAGKGVPGLLDHGACQDVIANYLNHTTRAANFGAYMNTQWETCQSNDEECLLDYTNANNPAAFTSPKTCSQGSIPPYYFQVKNAADVLTAFAFSKSTGTTLVIKNTGHDYKGRSSAPNSLALWMNQLKSIKYEPAFVEDGCNTPPAIKPPKAVTFGAGATHGLLYEFAESMNITLPGGSDSTVGAAGGYLQGGGHSAVSNVYGLAVDRVLQMRVVTPDGQERVVNRCTNTDLFFALRGGGGGTFGVVLEVTMLALPKLTLPSVTISYNGTDASQRAFLKFIIDNSMSYAQQGWGGYISPRQNLILINPILNETQAAASMETLRVFVTEQLHGQFQMTVEPSYLAFFNKYIVPSGVPVGLPFTTTSRLIPTKNFATEQSRQELLDHLIPAMDSYPLPIIFAVTPFLYNATTGTSVPEAWRNSLWHVTGSSFWNFDTPTKVTQAIYTNGTRNMNLLREITPGGGAYQNEADVHEPDFESSFWGQNYARLVAIKRKYDPDHLLDCWQCVDWKGSQNPKYRCYL